MKKVLQIIQLLLAIWGGISLLGVMLIAGCIHYVMTLENKTVVDKATKSDVRFVLNDCGLGNKRIDKVLNSYVSERLFIIGDYVDAYAIKITDITVDELINNKHNKVGLWYRGDALPPVLDDAVPIIGGWDVLPWFPTTDRIRTKDFYVYPRSIYYDGIRPDAARITLIQPAEKMVYYIDVKM
jgi:hypothetical protein